MGSTILTKHVLDGLEARFPGVFSEKNVCISGTHTHSGPAGFLQYALFQFSSLGFVPETLDAFVTGIVEATAMAHERARPARITLAVGKVPEGANINRSPTSYLLNPSAERARYADQGDTDRNMTLVRFVDVH